MPTSFPLGAMPLAKLKPAVTVELLPGDVLILLSDGFYEYLDVDGEEFGEQRVKDIVAAHGGEPMSDLMATLFATVDAFARGAPQDDDMTAVLVKRESEAASRTFRRTFDALPEIVRFTGEAFARAGIDPGLRPDVDFALEELFTNMVKYSAASPADIRIELTAVEGGVEVTLTDYDVEPFDITTAPDADVNLPIEQRRPGGLGLHIIRRLLDSIEYEYSKEPRQSRITFRKTKAAPPDAGRA
jgi:anti-sigma regulatory factor (Ser/Thr protein kinase)